MKPSKSKLPWVDYDGVVKIKCRRNKPVFVYKIAKRIIVSVYLYAIRERRSTCRQTQKLSSRKFHGSPCIACLCELDQI